MILTEKSLREFEESSFTTFTREQKQIILDRFETEPKPYTWSEQDIVEQIKKICSEHPAVKREAPQWV